MFYDMDNQRFMGWKQGYVDFLMQVLNPIRDKEGALFTFKTGMDLVYMESTRYSNGLVYAILQDAGENVVFTGSICRVTGMSRSPCTRI